jgi:hypothetical protein
MRKSLLMAMPVLLMALTLVARGGSDPGDTVTVKDSYGASPALSDRSTPRSPRSTSLPPSVGRPAPNPRQSTAWR